MPLPARLSTAKLITRSANYTTDNLAEIEELMVKVNIESLLLHKNYKLPLRVFSTKRDCIHPILTTDLIDLELLIDQAENWPLLCLNGTINRKFIN
jgi:hypothetical protein